MTASEHSKAKITPSQPFGATLDTIVAEIKAIQTKARAEGFTTRP